MKLSFFFCSVHTTANNSDCYRNCLCNNCGGFISLHEASHLEYTSGYHRWMWCHKRCLLRYCVCSNECKFVHGNGFSWLKWKFFDKLLTFKFGCCGLNHPDSMTNDTRIQTSCYSKDKYTIYDSYCQPERFYKINCFDQVYSDAMEKLLIILVYSVIMTAIQVRNSFLNIFRWRFFTILKMIIWSTTGINHLLCCVTWTAYSARKEQCYRISHSWRWCSYKSIQQEIRFLTIKRRIFLMKN